MFCITSFLTQRRRKVNSSGIDISYSIFSRSCEVSLLSVSLQVKVEIYFPCESSSRRTRRLYFLHFFEFSLIAEWRTPSSSSIVWTLSGTSIPLLVRYVILQRVRRLTLSVSCSKYFALQRCVWRIRLSRKTWAPDKALSVTRNFISLSSHEFTWNSICKLLYFL